MESLAQRLGARLKSAGALLVTAESCTGGWVAQAVTSVAGASDWFERGFVAYSNDAKRELLGVRPETRTAPGGGCAGTARAMARGALERGRGTLALSVTGIAGPGGGSAGKPVGTVCFAWARRDGWLASETRHFRGDRESVRRQSVIRALEGVLQALDGG
ncbi:MAG: CinA family protein [Betaproteobacteria bacterium]